MGRKKFWKLAVCHHYVLKKKTKVKNKSKPSTDSQVFFSNVTDSSFFKSQKALASKMNKGQF